jgi:hypothetical protein
MKANKVKRKQTKWNQSKQSETKANKVKPKLSMMSLIHHCSGKRDRGFCLNCIAVVITIHDSMICARADCTYVYTSVQMWYVWYIWRRAGGEKACWIAWFSTKYTKRYSWARISRAIYILARNMPMLLVVINNNSCVVPDTVYCRLLVISTAHFLNKICYCCEHISYAICATVVRGGLWWAYEQVWKYGSCQYGRNV